MIQTVEHLWDEKEYAAYRNMPVSSAQKERHYGNGPPYIKTRRLVRYDPAVVRSWLASHTVQSTAEAA